MMTTNAGVERVPSSRHRIVVGVDGSENSLEAVGWGAAQAQLTGSILEIVVAFGPDYVYVNRNEAMELMQKDVADAIGHAECVAPGLEIMSRTFGDLPATSLVRESKSAELLVVGSRGRGGFASLLLGSVSRKCVHLACCPVVVVGAGLQRDTGDSEATAKKQFAPRIVVGFDGSPASVAAADWSAKQARLTGANLEVLMTWEPAGQTGLATCPASQAPERDARAILEDMIGAFRGAYPDVTINPRVAQGHPGDLLVRASRGADILAVGNRGCKGQFGGLLFGSVKEHCLTNARSPVVVVNARE